MKKWDYIRYSFAFLGCVLTGNMAAQTNRALIVTISNYPPRSGWESIHANNDKEYILPLLTEKGFKREHITVLSDAQATKRKVTDAFTTLYKEAQPGDAIFIHFSCHGQQMMDDNGDEEDGLDESMVLYDAGYQYIKGTYEGQNHLRDDELGVWIDRLRRQVGKKGRVTLTLDACHSGTANRDERTFTSDYKEYIRGTTAIFAPEGYIPQPGKHPERSLRLEKKGGLAPAVVFSACLPELTNYEYYDRQRSMYVGKLTYAFCKQIRETKTPRTIKNFFSQLIDDMFYLNRNNLRLQIPYMECSDETVLFFIGQTR